MFNPPQWDLWYRGLLIPAMLLSAVIARWLMHSVSQDLGQRLPPLKTRTLMLIAISAGLTALPFNLTPLQQTGLLPVATLLIALACIDWRYRLLPDRLTQPLLWAGLLANQQGCFTSLNEAVTGATAGYLSLWLLNAGYRWRRKKEGIGQGDFKMLAALGAWSGWSALPMLVTGAAVAGLCVATLACLRRSPGRDAPLPFGLYLALSGWFTLLSLADMDITPFIKGNSLISAYFTPMAD
ncbi:prepilin peptidase [Serratia liquefaciens]|uniref:prepilin peptidase n=1 Tax=Serratia liquefaciens TaxID=614 RepID=UPI0022DD740C|nr:A24 family peptidase [Serratia liquefaciens]WBL73417.1 A24 family peptidase [Serratia liquefaciens]